MARVRFEVRDRLDRDLRRYLIDGEHVVVSVRKHWMSEVKPAAAFVLALVLALWMDINAPATATGASAAQFFWLLWLVTVGWLAWRVLNWRRDWFVATDKRFLLFYGFIHRRVAMMPLAKVTDLTFHRSILARLLGYGDFRLESAGQDQALSRIDFIPQADRHYRAICAVLFGDKDTLFASEWDDDEDGDDGGGGGGDGDGGPGDPAHPKGPASHAAGPAPAQPHTPLYAPAGSPAPAYAGRSPRGPGRGIRHEGPEWDVLEEDSGGESLYRSEDLVRSRRLDDTGEIEIIAARPMPSRRPAGPDRGPRPGRRRQ